MRIAFSRGKLWWQSIHADGAEAIERVPDRWIPAAIFLASVLALYVEMVMIRWHATSSHAFAIFKNVSLLSCFLGLGIGYGLAAQRRAISLAGFLPILAGQVLFFSLISTTIGGIRVNPVAEQVVMGLPSRDWNWLQAVAANLFLAAIFLVNAGMFIPMGYLSGRLMNRLPAMRGYALNLAGSLAGIGLFFLLSLAWSPPSVWMAICVALALPFLIGQPRLAIVGIASMVVIVIALGTQGRLEDRRYYSPYQVITLRLPVNGGVLPTPTIKVNHAFYQAIENCSGAAVAVSQRSADAAAYYNLPYRFRKEPGDVLVVGAGSGNDVAAALRHGARSVTAVEIDPAILYLGRKLHPEGPYQDSRTKAVVNDARSFMRQTDARFDTIIYGLLDSHTNLGSMTNVRLDSFVYTVEGFREAIARLKPGGLLVITYQFLYQGHDAKCFAMLEKVFPGRAPRAFQTGSGLMLVTGPGLAGLPATVPGASECTADVRARALQVDLPTDDWPYFYMQKRTYPLTYAVMVLLLLGISAWLVKKKLGMHNLASPRSGVFFFLGAGFMLIETKVITELGLVFGNTWLVTAIAIAGILLMCFLANYAVSRFGAISPVRSFVLLGVTLAAGLLVTRLSMAGMVLPTEKLVMPILLTLPLFFAGLIFSSQLVRCEGLGNALSANLFGAMLGGFLEYNSMYLGMSSLYVFGIVLYALAYVCLWLDGRAAAVLDLRRQEANAARSAA
jgi:SAM-dependent methyltransferase